jgi:hypothetical protein
VASQCGGGAGAVLAVPDRVNSFEPGDHGSLNYMTDGVTEKVIFMIKWRSRWQKFHT